MTPDKNFPMWAWPGSRDHDNSTVQTAAMGQIPRSTERILVINGFLANRYVDDDDVVSERSNANIKLTWHHQRSSAEPVECQSE